MTPELQSRIIDFVQTADGWCTPEKALKLANVILDRAIHTTVEIGIFGGRSLIPMAMACQLQEFGTVTGIDPWTAEAALEGENSKENDLWWSKQIDLEAVYRGFIQRVMSNNITKECRWIRATSEECLPMWPDNSIGLLHLDSNHSEECSVRDVKHWLPKLKKDGVFVLDDSNWASQAKAIETLCKSGGFSVVERFPQSNGQEFAMFSR